MRESTDSNIGRSIRPATDEHGAVLVLVALLSVGLLGLAGVVIDLGIVRRTQSEMQAATDQAAIEGIRFRDVGGANPDRNRRDFATLAVRRAFQTDINVGGPSFGAGPDINRSNELGRFGGLLTVGGEGDGDSALDLIPALNEQNFQNGDLVAGEFDPLAPAIELADYSRLDFRVSTATEAAGASAFLARLRRTPASGPRSTPLDRESGISNAGPPVPLLFARGSTLQGAPIEDDGMTVRAASIAATRPAVRVSRVVDGDAVLVMVPGFVAPTTTPFLPAFGLASLPNATSFELEIQPDGSILAPAIDSTVLGVTLATAPRWVGQPVTRTSISTPLPPGTWLGVLPILQALPAAEGEFTRLAGFVSVEFASDGTTLSVMLSPTSRVLPVGATALDPEALSTLLSFPALRAQFESLPARVLAPVLAR
ncbi:MAG: pilus assembly protein TadG-related protein [Planctomycetota bacterium]